MMTVTSKGEKQNAGMNMTATMGKIPDYLWKLLQLFTNFLPTSRRTFFNMCKPDTYAYYYLVSLHKPTDYICR